MKLITKEQLKTPKMVLLAIWGFFFMMINTVEAQYPDPNQGLRAEWLRGTWGINWKPVNLYNGGHEGLSIKPFLNQISHIKTIDYIQVHLGESSIKSSVHMGPHPLLESFWEGDTDGSGNPINLVVPRESFGEDPFLEIVKDIRAAGMKVMVYVNSSNMLSREGPGGSNPDYIPNITERWKAWCDTNPEAQAFIASQPYHTGVWDAATGTYVNAEAEFPERKYMFCYAEFVLKVYAIRYGDLLDAWCFDSGSWMGMNGDSQTNGVYEDQMIFNAFKAACHAGNPNAALSFQNSPERDTEELNPFSEAVHADDFMFGHPYNGGRDGGSHTIGTPSLYSRNYAHIEKMKETNGYAHRGSDPQTWTWDDNVVAHYDPPMSTTSWNGGGTPALTDEEFNLWNLEAVQNGGAISWGLPLVAKSGTNEQLVANAWALAQLNGMDAHLMELESPGAPNWARQETVLSDAKPGESYSHNLVDGVDFWDPEGDGVTGLSVVSGSLPTWATLIETAPGTWTLSGTPTETAAANYTFVLSAEDADGATDREVTLQVVGHPAGFTNPGDGAPVWYSNPIVLANATALQGFESLLEKEVDFYDFEGDALTISKISGPDWLNLDEISQESWRLSGTPSAEDAGENSFTFRVSDGVLSSDTEIKITVEHASGFTDLGNGNPVWSSSSYNLLEGEVLSSYTDILQLGTHFYDFEGGTLTITKIAGADWLDIQEASPGIWELSGTPTALDEGENVFTLNLSDGVNASTAEILITVNPVVVSDSNVQIKAAANTNYGINTVATMYSEVQTAPDGLATFRISIDVTPPEIFSITSGASGGSATENSWGMGDGSTTNQETLFRGSDNQWVESINNIQIIDFNANGGTITEEDITGVFKSITVVNAHNANDSFSLKVGTTVSNARGASEGIETIDLLAETGVSDDITDFAIGTGNTATNNRWSVEGITVSVSVDGYSLSNPDPIVDQVETFKLFPNPANDKISFNIKPVKTQIFEITGKRVIMDTKGTSELNVSSLSKGVYIIKVQTIEGNIFFKKFLKN